MSDSDELACVFAALILSDDQVAITGDKIAAILKAANVSVEPYWPGLFAKALDGLNVKELITNVGSSAGAASVAVAGSVPAAAVAAPAAGKPAEAEAKKEDKKKEESEESDEDMGFGLFD